MKKSISVVLPNYNGRKLLEQYLPSVFRALVHAELDYEFFIVDDASSDDSVAFIKQHYPQVELLVNKQNKGFSYSCNQGIFKARKELVFLLNSDVRLEENYFDALGDYFDDKETFGVMGQIRSADGAKIEDAARILTYKGFGFKATKFYYDANPLNTSVYTAYLSGANALICREKLLSLEGFNEIYAPYYAEDFDLSLRAWKLGWKCYYEHGAVCYHQVQATTATYARKNCVSKIYYKNYFILQAIHLPSLNRFFWYFQLFFMYVLGKLLLGKWWVWQSFILFIKSNAAIKQSRAKFNSLQALHQSNINIKDIMRQINRGLNADGIHRL